ncbi:MAG: oligopeptide ABC transporter ATP-binding protein [candidate division NC10 bacterium CSP1-5]|nr:MAG: oligopeptide ABC transporter ATP-binding protein [candidate division NC10 bacterium CSP1-5]
MRNGSLLTIQDLQTHFFTGEGVVRAVDGVTLSVRPGETLGLVGESGCGKTVTALSILRLIPNPPGRIVGGTICFEGRDLLRLPEEEMRSIRGCAISMIFQEPMTSLNPVFTVGEQVAEGIRHHQKVSRREAWDRAVEVLRRVKIPDPARRAYEYPHQLSGGLRQRVMIAMALALGPRLLIADEPTTALDVTIQAQIVDLLMGLQEEMQMAVILITHDLGVIAETADRVVVMYAGRVVEEASAEQLFETPLHPYTQGLLESLPKLETGKRHRRLTAIPGLIPNLLDLPTGCKFAPRCPKVIGDCWPTEPELREIRPGHWARCILA